MSGTSFSSHTLADNNSEMSLAGRVILSGGEASLTAEGSFEEERGGWAADEGGASVS